jgi:hypothetical protein
LIDVHRQVAKKQGGIIHLHQKKDQENLASLPLRLCGKLCLALLRQKCLCASAVKISHLCIIPMISKCP